MKTPQTYQQLLEKLNNCISNPNEENYSFLKKVDPLIRKISDIQKQKLLYSIKKVAINKYLFKNKS